MSPLMRSSCKGIFHWHFGGSRAVMSLVNVLLATIWARRIVVCRGLYAIQASWLALLLSILLSPRRGCFVWLSWKLLVHRAGIKAAAHRKEAAAGGGSCPAAAGSCPAGQGSAAHLNWSSASRRGRARLCLAVREICRVASQVPVQRL